MGTGRSAECRTEWIADGTVGLDTKFSSSFFGYSLLFWLTRNSQQ